MTTQDLRAIADQLHRRVRYGVLMTRNETTMLANALERIAGEIEDMPVFAPNVVRLPVLLRVVE